VGHHEDICWTGKGAHLSPQRGYPDREGNTRNPSGSQANRNNQEVPLYLDSIEPLSRAYMCGNLTRSRLQRATRESQAWHVDSGATDWICKNRSSFVKYEKFQVPRPIILGDDSEVLAIGSGTVRIYLSDCILRVNRVLFSPDMGINLMSARRIAERKGTLQINDKGCTITAGAFHILARLDESTGLYTIHEDLDSYPNSLELSKRRSEQLSDTRQYCRVNAAISRAEAIIENTNLRPRKKPSRVVQRWHKKLGHLHYNAVKTVLRKMGVAEGRLADNEEDDDHICEPCIYGKSTQRPFRSPPSQPATRPLELIHIDGNGLWQTASLAKKYTGIANATHPMAKYVLVLVDDFTGFV
jgi:hypothetical protein